MRKIFLIILSCLSLIFISIPRSGISDVFYFDQNNAGLLGGPWGEIVLTRLDDYTVRFSVVPYEGAFSSLGGNFGIQTFAFNFDKDGLDLSLALPAAWSGKYNENKISGYGPYGKFDFEVKGKGSTRLTLLEFSVSSPFKISISDFTSELSTNGILFAGHIAGFSEGKITSAMFADPPTSVPEPSTMLLLGSGLIGLAGFARRRLRR